MGEGAAPSWHANLYKTPLHGWCYPRMRGVVLSHRGSYRKNISGPLKINSTC